jgi:hypothetical protein
VFTIREGRDARTFLKFLRWRSWLPRLPSLSNAVRCISKAFPKGQLSQRHAQELIQAREGLHFERASIAGDATTERRSEGRWSREDVASTVQTPVCLGSLMAPTKLCFAGSQNPRSEFKSRPREFAAYAFLINNLWKAIGKTLGHY